MIRMPIAVAALALLAEAVLSVGRADAQTASQPLKVGVLTTLTGSGAILSGSINVGYRLAFKELETGGVAGRPLQLVWSDDQGDPTIGVGEIKRLVQVEKVDVVVGPTAGAVTLAIAPILNEAKVSEFSVSGSNQLTPEVSHYQFTNSPNSDIVAIAMVNYVVDVMKAKTPGMLTDTGAASKAAAGAIRKAFDDHQAQLVVAEEFTPPGADLTPQLLSLRHKNPDVILVWTTTPIDFGTMVKNLSDIGWDVKLVTNPTIGVLTGSIAQVAGPHAFDNTVSATYRPFTYCRGDNVDEIDGAKFAAKVKAFLPNDYEHVGVISAAIAYDSVYLMKAAVEGAGTTDALAITDWVEKNAGSVHAFTLRLAGSKTKHALADPADMVMVRHPELHNAQGLTERADCP